MVKRAAGQPLSAVVIGSLAVAICAGTAGVAVAYWNGTGDGTGTALTADVRDLTVSPGTPTATLSPAARAAVVLTVSNPNSIAVFIASLELDTAQGTGGFAVDPGHSGCAVSTLSFTTQTNAGAGWTVPRRVAATDGTVDITLANAVSMSAAAANSCQGALFTVYLRART